MSILGELLCMSHLKILVGLVHVHDNAKTWFQGTKLVVGGYIYYKFRKNTDIIDSGDYMLVRIQLIQRWLVTIDCAK